MTKSPLHIFNSSVDTMVELIGEHLPEGWLVCLVMEQGAAWVELSKHNKRQKLPDAADKPLTEQLNDALCVANGWDREENS